MFEANCSKQMDQRKKHVFLPNVFVFTCGALVLCWQVSKVSTAARTSTSVRWGRHVAPATATTSPAVTAASAPLAPMVLSVWSVSQSLLCTHTHFLSVWSVSQSLLCTHTHLLSGQCLCLCCTLTHTSSLSGQCLSLLCTHTHFLSVFSVSLSL